MTDLIILGPSTRAAAYSARRAGFRPWCVDLFADTDLRAIAPAFRLPVQQYPQGCVPLVQDHAPLAPIIYTGGLEHYPQVLGELSKDRPLWGYLHTDPFNGDSVRNPCFLQDVCDQAGIARPAWSPRPANVPADGSWLVKPKAGTGGLRIAPWLGQPLTNPDDFFFQKKIAGDSLSAIFLSTGTDVKFLGVTKQFVGEGFLHAPTAYAYAGNETLAAETLGHDRRQQLTYLARTLCKADACLRGLFGVDLILADDSLHLIEVNPRYTASVEVLEYSTGRPLMRDHALAFASPAQLPPVVPAPNVPSGQVHSIGKAIYYAPRRLQFPGMPALFCAPDPWDVPQYGDVPATGENVNAGEPVLTLFHAGENTHQALRQKAAELDHCFFP